MTTYLDKRKISGIEKRARGLIASSNTTGKVLAGLGARYPVQHCNRGSVFVPPLPVLSWP